jgi:hypothetical protein
MPHKKTYFLQTGIFEITIFKIQTILLQQRYCFKIICAALVGKALAFTKEMQPNSRHCSRFTLKAITDDSMRT